MILLCLMPIAKFDFSGKMISTTMVFPEATNKSPFKLTSRGTTIFTGSQWSMPSPQVLKEENYEGSSEISTQWSMVLGQF